jgi:hypothetical protein
MPSKDIWLILHSFISALIPLDPLFAWKLASVQTCFYDIVFWLSIQVVVQSKVVWNSFTHRPQWFSSLVYLHLVFNIILTSFLDSRPDTELCEPRWAFIDCKHLIIWQKKILKALFCDEDLVHLYNYDYEDACPQANHHEPRSPIIHIHEGGKDNWDMSFRLHNVGGVREIGCLGYTGRKHEPRKYHQELVLCWGR